MRRIQTHRREQWSDFAIKVLLDPFVLRRISFIVGDELQALLFQHRHQLFVEQAVLLIHQQMRGPRNSFETQL